MSLEQLIEDVQESRDVLFQSDVDLEDATLDTLEEQLNECESLLIDYILEHADELISWERRNIIRTSPFDTDGEV